MPLDREYKTEKERKEDRAKIFLAVAISALTKAEEEEKSRKKEAQ